MPKLHFLCPLRLAGTYDLDPPEGYDGHNGWFRWNPSQTVYPTPHLDWCEKAIGGVPRELVPNAKALVDDPKGQQILVAVGLQSKRAKAYHYGKGRIVCIDVPGPAHWSFEWKAYYETRSTYFANAARYAAGRNPVTTVCFAQTADAAGAYKVILRDMATGLDGVCGVELGTGN